MVNPERGVGIHHIGPHGNEFGFYFYIMKNCRGILGKNGILIHFKLH